MIYKDGKFVEYVPPPPNADQNKLKAISLLTATPYSLLDAPKFPSVHISLRD
jgi:hypothetical protein